MSKYYNVECWLEEWDPKEPKEVRRANGIISARKIACKMLSKYKNGTVNIRPIDPVVEQITYNKWQDRYQIVNTYSKYKGREIDPRTGKVR